MPKQITLVRHAKVLIEDKQRIKASQMPNWIDAYNHAFVDSTLPSMEMVEQLRLADVVLASSLSRTHDTLKLLDITPSKTLSLFDEAEIPKSSKIPMIKLYPKIWLVVLRMMMLLGIGKESESFLASKSRAKEAVKYLIKLTSIDEKVALMGYGGINWLIAKALEKEGWTCVKNTKSSKNWGYRVYEK